LQFLLRRLQLLLFACLSVILIDSADVDVVHLWQKFALRYVARFALTHVAQAAGRIDTEWVSAVGGSSLLPKCVQLYLAESLRMIPLAAGSVWTITF